MNALLCLRKTSAPGPSAPGLQRQNRKTSLVRTVHDVFRSIVSTQPPMPCRVAVTDLNETTTLQIRFTAFQGCHRYARFRLGNGSQAYVEVLFSLADGATTVLSADGRHLEGSTLQAHLRPNSPQLIDFAQRANFVNIYLDESLLCRLRLDLKGLALSCLNVYGDVNVDE
ncbi:unnamed protein product, partial [Mesorhabditis spiculigera]